MRRIPPGRVMTYGQVARAIGVPGAARTVGWALRICPAGDVPCHRVITASGQPSPGYGHGDPDRQRLRLEAEGVEFDAAGRVDLKRYGGQPE